MAYTQEEWQWIKSRFTEGCRFLYEGKHGATIHLGRSYIGDPTDRIYAKFDNPTYAQQWHERGMNTWFLLISDCIWPNGSPMIPFVEYDGKPYNRVLAKIASLDARFKAKSLPKSTQKALPLPA